MKDKAIIVCDNCGKEFNNFEILEDELNNGEIRRSYIAIIRNMIMKYLQLTEK